MNQKNKSSQNFYYLAKRKNDTSVHTFACACLREKCRSISSTTQRPCTRFTVNGLGWCHVHLQKHKSLRIDKTRQRLYTTKQFDSNTVIIEFDGEKLTRDELNDRYRGKKPPYVMVLSENTVQDASCKRGISAFVRQRHNSVNSTNSRIEKYNDVYVIISTKHIKANREIIVYNPNNLLGNEKTNEWLTYYQTTHNKRIPKFYKQGDKKYPQLNLNSNSPKYSIKNTPIQVFHSTKSKIKNKHRRTDNGTFPRLNLNSKFPIYVSSKQDQYLHPNIVEENYTEQINNEERPINEEKYYTDENTTVTENESEQVSSTNNIKTSTRNPFEMFDEIEKTQKEQTTDEFKKYEELLKKNISNKLPSIPEQNETPTETETEIKPLPFSELSNILLGDDDDDEEQENDSNGVEWDNVVHETTKKNTNNAFDVLREAMRTLKKDDVITTNQSQEDNGKDSETLKQRKQTNITKYISKTQKTNDKEQSQTETSVEDSENTDDDSFNITLDIHENFNYNIRFNPLETHHQYEFDVMYLLLSLILPKENTRYMGIDIPPVRNDRMSQVMIDRYNEKANIVREDVRFIKKYIFKRYNLCLFILCEDHFTALYINSKGESYYNDPLGYKMNHKIETALHVLLRDLTDYKIRIQDKGNQIDCGAYTIFLLHFFCTSDAHLNQVPIKTLEEQSVITKLREYHHQVLENIGYFSESYDIIKQQSIAKAEGRGESIVSDSTEKKEKMELFKYFVQWFLYGVLFFAKKNTGDNANDVTDKLTRLENIMIRKYEKYMTEDGVPKEWFSFLSDVSVFVQTVSKLGLNEYDEDLVRYMLLNEYIETKLENKSKIKSSWTFDFEGYTYNYHQQFKQTFEVTVINILESLDTIIDKDALKMIQHNDTVRSQYMDDLNEKVNSFHGFVRYYVDKAIKIYPKTLSLTKAIKNYNQESVLIYRYLQILIRIEETNKPSAQLHKFVYKKEFRYYQEHIFNKKHEPYESWKEVHNEYLIGHVQSELMKKFPKEYIPTVVRTSLFIDFKKTINLYIVYKCLYENTNTHNSLETRKKLKQKIQLYYERLRVLYLLPNTHVLETTLNKKMYSSRLITQFLTRNKHRFGNVDIATLRKCCNKIATSYPLNLKYRKRKNEMKRNKNSRVTLNDLLHTSRFVPIHNTSYEYILKHRDIVFTHMFYLSVHRYFSVHHVHNDFIEILRKHLVLTKSDMDKCPKRQIYYYMYEFEHNRTISKRFIDLYNYRCYFNNFDNYRIDNETKNDSK